MVPLKSCRCFFILLIMPHISNNNNNVNVQVVWHSCHLCGKLVLLDSDALGAHIKSTHKMKEKDYKDKYCVYVKQKSMTPQPSERDDGSRNIAKRKQSGQIEEDFEPPQKKQKSLAAIEEQIEGVI